MSQCQPAAVLVRRLENGWDEAEVYGPFENTSHAQIWAEGFNFGAKGYHAKAIPWHSTSIG